MPNTRPPYPPEFRQRILALARSGRSPESLSDEFKVSSTSIRTWMKQDDLDAGRPTDDLTTDERAELTRLRRENRVLLEECEILKKAQAWFSRETDSESERGTTS